jgi:hypothetical protein
VATPITRLFLGLMPVSLAIIFGENKTNRHLLAARLGAATQRWHSPRNTSYSQRTKSPSFCKASDKLQFLAEERIRGISEKHSWQRESSADSIRANNVGPDAFNAGVFRAEDLC